jgi:hypothetical protein
MNLGQLFVTMGFKLDKGISASQSKFIAGLKQVQEKAIALKNKISTASGFSDFSKGFKQAAQESTGFVGFLGRMVTAANLARAAILGAVAAMVKLTMNAAEASEHLFKFAINTGMDTTALQKWQQQAGMAGVQADDVANSFKEMQRKAMEIQLGQASPGAFQMAGVDWTGSPEKMMNQIQKMLKSRPAGMGTKLASDMGLSEEMISFLRLRDGMEPAQEGLILSPEEIADLKDFNMQFTGAMNAMKQALIKFGAMIAPITKPLINLFSRVMMAVADFIKFLNSLGAMKMKIIGIGAAIAGALMAAFFPVTATVMAVAALIALVFLAVDDVASFIRGDDSITGRIIKNWRQGLSDMFGWVKDNWKIIVDWISTGFVDGVKVIWSFFSDMFSWIRDNWKVLLSYIGSEVTNAWDGVKSLFGFGGDGEAKPATTAPSFGVPATAGAGAGGVQQNINIQVDGSKDPKVVGNEIATRLKRETTNAFYQMPRTEK